MWGLVSHRYSLHNKFNLAVLACAESTLRSVSLRGLGVTYFANISAKTNFLEKTFNTDGFDS